MKTFTGPPVNCAYNGGFASTNFIRGDCVRFDFVIPGSDTGSHTAAVQVRSADGSTLFQTVTATQKSGGVDWYAVTPIDPAATPWQPGMVIARVMVDGNPTSDTPFFFNQLRFSGIPEVMMDIARGDTFAGVKTGNLMASVALIMILFISIIAVFSTIILPLGSTTTWP